MIMFGKSVELKMRKLAFDASNPPDPQSAQKLLQQVAKALGVDADDPDALRQAFESLLEAAGVDGGDPNSSAVTDPKVVDAAKKLTAQQRRICREHGISPIRYVATRLALRMG